MGHPPLRAGARRRDAGVALAPLALLLVAACGGGGGGGTKPVPLSARYPIDGVVDFAGLDVHSVLLDFVSGTKSSTLDYAFANDDRDLYVALQWSDDTFNNGYDFSGPTDFDGVDLLVDDDGDGTYEDGEDNRFVITATPVGSQYLDQHKSASGADFCGDGFGRLTYDAVNQRYQAEMRFPRTADAQGEDATITAATRFNLILFDHAQPGISADVAYLFPSDTDSTGWGTVPLVASPPIPRAPLPSGLTGLIVFTAVDDDPEAEIYTLDPASGAATRVTNNTTYEDNVSLSHDRQWIAFHGAPSRTDYSNYEIWKVRVDGSGLTQLTNNSILDGHPGWSPDDSTICYASFRDAGAASIVVMDSDGNEIADLTTAPDDDNDPDFLQDGRIVFKTNRFNASPQVKIATMAADGSDLQQVTFDAFSPNSSDHDPVGDATFAIFERFTKGTDYSTDIEALFSPWDIIEARLDGTDERIVVADGFVNWLPVYDPTGQYIAHLKSPGYTDLHLLTRAGFDFGRLLPNRTQMRYLDWK
jgi:WD40 repeat protein